MPLSRMLPLIFIYFFLHMRWGIVRLDYLEQMILKSTFGICESICRCSSTGVFMHDVFLLLLLHTGWCLSLVVCSTPIGSFFRL